MYYCIMYMYVFDRLCITIYVFWSYIYVCKKARVAHEAMTVSAASVSQHMKMTCLTRLERTGLAVFALHEEYMEDCVLDSTGKERLRPLCVDVFAV